MPCALGDRWDVGDAGGAMGDPELVERLRHLIFDELPDVFFARKLCQLL